MFKHTQTVPQLLQPNCLSGFGHFVGLILKALPFIGGALSRSCQITMMEFIVKIINGCILLIIDGFL